MSAVWSGVWNVNINTLLSVSFVNRIACLLHMWALLKEWNTETLQVSLAVEKGRGVPSHHSSSDRTCKEGDGIPFSCLESWPSIGRSFHFLPLPPSRPALQCSFLLTLQRSWWSQQGPPTSRDRKLISVSFSRSTCGILKNTTKQARLHSNTMEPYLPLQPFHKLYRTTKVLRVLRGGGHVTAEHGIHDQTKNTNCPTGCVILSTQDNPDHSSIRKLPIIQISQCSLRVWKHSMSLFQEGTNDLLGLSLENDYCCVLVWLIDTQAHDMCWHASVKSYSSE